MSEDNQESTEAETTQGKENDEVVGSSALRPVFLGNLSSSYKTEDVIEIFERPILPRDAAEGSFSKMPVERIDHKRGYCFVFLKDVTSQSEKEQTERFVNSITGM